MSSKCLTFEVIIPVGKGGLNDLSRALNNGPNQTTSTVDDGNGYYLFWGE